MQFYRKLTAVWPFLCSKDVLFQMSQYTKKVAISAINMLSVKPRGAEERGEEWTDKEQHSWDCLLYTSDAADDYLEV